MTSKGDAPLTAALGESFTARAVTASSAPAPWVGSGPFRFASVHETGAGAVDISRVAEIGSSLRGAHAGSSDPDFCVVSRAGSY